MDLLTLKSIGVVGAFAAIGGAWSYIKSFFIRFKSLFIITASMEDHNIGHAVFGYLRENYKRSDLGSMKFSSCITFVNTLNKRLRVGYIIPSETMTFFDGWKPLFLSKTKDANSNSDGLTVTFIRGTFDIRDIVKKSLDRINHISSDNNKKDVRFRVIECFGTYGNSKDSNVERSTSLNYEINEIKSYEIVGFEIDDLGQFRLPNPFDNLYYNEPVNDFVKELDRWIGSKEWFNERGLPWRMGTLLKGLPGTGKSSFVKAVGQKYNLPVYRFDLISMSNEELNDNWNRALSNSPCICLLEDMDRLYNEKGEMVNSEMMQTKGKLTTDAILNCISGVGDSSGILTIVTANHPEKLPQAMTRAGRLDVDLELGYLTKENKMIMASKILTGNHQISKEDEMYSKVIELVENSGEITGAAFQRNCTKVALDIYWNRVD